MKMEDTMKRISTVVAVCLMMASAATAEVAFLSEAKDQLITQTKLTIMTSGGPAAFWDFSTGQSDSLRGGLVSHVLTNRFITGDIGLYGGLADQGVDAVLVGGPGIVLTKAFTYFFPTTSELIQIIIPQELHNFYIGANLGWGTSHGEPHYGIHLGLEM